MTQSRLNQQASRMSLLAEQRTMAEKCLETYGLPSTHKPKNIWLFYSGDYFTTSAQDVEIAMINS